MASDRSRTSDDVREAYRGVVAQQGRVILDRDFNALETLLSARTAADALDFVGPCGTADDGFAISVPAKSPPAPPLWVPPPPLPAPAAHRFDLRVSPGTMYVGGQRAVLAEGETALSYAYFDQPDWIAPDDPLPGTLVPAAGNEVMRIEFQHRFELVYLDLAEQEVSAVEDPDLLDVALGGPDTTQRTRLRRRIRRLPARSADCAASWTDAAGLWRERDGLVLDPRDLSLAPLVRLQVGFAQDAGAANPCDPIATGGYLGAENQLIRVAISDAGASGQAELIWGYDDASFLYRVAAVSGGGTRLALAADPPDAFHIPATGQAVEILRTAAVLGSAPDATDPTGKAVILRCVAEPTGVVRTLTQPYGAIGSADPTKQLVLDHALPAEYLADKTPLFVRVWQGRANFPPSGGTVALVNPVSGAATGVTVTISLPKGAVLTEGAYWQIALRPATPQAVYPERFLTAPQPPDGPRQWACALATVDWTSVDWAKIETPVVHDCRRTFESLVALTRRHPGCCSIGVRPEDLRVPGNDLQAIIDRAAALGPGARVCFDRGTYLLKAPLVLTVRHAGLTLEGCADGVAIGPDPAADAAAFADGLVVLEQAPRITLSGLSLVPAAAALPVDLAKRLIVLPRMLERSLPAVFAAAIGEVAKFAESTSRAIAVMIGVRAVQSLDLEIADCRILFGDPKKLAASTSLLGIGLLAEGECSRLAVRRCQFGGGTLVPTVTPVTLLAKQAGVAAGSTVVGAGAGAATAAAGPTVASAGTVASGATIARGATIATPPRVSSGVVREVAVTPQAERVATLSRLATGFTAPGVATEPVAAAAAAPTVAGGAAAGATAGGAAAAGPAHFVSLLGCLVTPYAQDLLAGEPLEAYPLTVPAVLGAAEITDTLFTGLTLPALVMAELGALRVTGNRVAGCAGGLWVMPLSQRRLVFNSKLLAGDTLLLVLAMLFEETFLAVMLGLILPPPSPPATVAARGTESSLDIARNDVSALPSATAEGSCALAVLTDQITAVPAAEMAVRIADNRFVGRLPYSLPTALIAYFGRCAVQGNLVGSEPADAGAAAGSSLHIFAEGRDNNLSAPALTNVPPPADTSNTARLAVSGNVFEGSTNLDKLLRPDTANLPEALRTWVFWNAIS